MSIKDFYDENGYVLLKKAIPDDLIENYEQSSTIRDEMVEKHSDVFAKWGEGIYFKTP